MSSELGRRSGRLDEEHVGAGIAVQNGTLDGRLEPFHGNGIGARR